jgi:3-oxoadipate enol-lactonase/4-carboxymuconolactone decarboxylase
MFVSRPDAELYAVAFGNGPRTLLAMGGWVGSWELWAEPFGMLSASWRVIGYDHRGAGATVAPPESITVPVLVDDLFAVLDAFAIDQCVLAAESAGAAIALQAALRQPARFGGLVLVDGLYHRERPQGADPFVRALQADFQATLGQFVDACVPEPDSAAIRRWGRQIVGRSTPAAAIRLYECLYEIDLRPQVAQITLPSLIIHGEADQIVPLDAAEWLAAELPNSRLVVLPGAGHVPTITRPEAVAGAIDQFFAG